MADTTYIVLRAVERGLWQPRGDAVVAASAKDAVRKQAEIDAAPEGIEDGRYVAVPARSWKPVTVEAVQTTVLKLT